MALTNQQKVNLFAFGDEDSTFYSSDAIDCFIAQTNTLMGAAALALYSAAGSKALLARLKETLNFKGDDRSISKELRATADALRKQEATTPAVDVAEQGFGPIGRHKILDNQFARSGFGNAE